MDENVEVETVHPYPGHFRCEGCGFSGDATVYGLGRGEAWAKWGLHRDRAMAEARAQSERKTAVDAERVFALAPCPGCGRRDPRAVAHLRSFWSFATAVGVVLWLAAMAVVWLLGPRFGLGSVPLAVIVVVGPAALLYAWITRYWAALRDAERRLHFHDPRLAHLVARIPKPRRNQEALGAWLLLFGGVLGLALSGSRAMLVLDNPEPVVLDCTPQALSDMRVERWVSLPGCVADAEDFSLRYHDETPSSAFVPLRPADGGAPLAVLMIHDYKAMKHFVTADEARLRGDQAAMQQALDRAADEMPWDPPIGLTRDDPGSEGFELERDLPDLQGSPSVVIDANQRPSWSEAGFFFVAGIVALGLGVYYWPRRKWTTVGGT